MNILDVYPVNTLLFYYSDDVDPNVTIGGTWVKCAGKTFQGLDSDGNVIGDYGGAYLRMRTKPTEAGATDYGEGYVGDTSSGRTLTVDRLPKHTHQVTATFPTKSVGDQDGSVVDYLQYNSGSTGGYRNNGSLEYTTESTGGGGTSGTPINLEPEYVCLVMWQRTA